MIRASLYITVCSARNRMRVRLRRLREPRYLFGTIAAILYLYFTVFARACGRRPFGRRPGAGRPGPFGPGERPSPSLPFDAVQAGGPTLVGLGLLLVMAGAWLFPGDGGGMLEFSAAETQLLFPAPVSRRALIVHRLLRSQLGLLFAALVPALLFSSASGASRLKFAVAMWVILSTLRVHFTGITLARASLMLRGADAKRRQWGPLVLMLAAIIVVAASVWRTLAAHPPATPRDLATLIGEVGATGVSHWILWPFMALARPLFAPWPGPYLLALLGALGVLAVNVAWVLSSDEAFQEAVAQSEARRAARKQRDRPVIGARTTRWPLPAWGGPEIVLAWKSAMQLLRNTTGAAAIRFIAPVLAVTIGVTGALVAATHATGVAALLGLVGLAVAAFAIVLGPQMMRADLREDLLHLELLKTWPVGASALIRGEMLAPVAALTFIAWASIASALVISIGASLPIALSMRVSIAAMLAVLAPALIASQFTVQNAAAVLFPAWVALGSQRPRGLDAMGQRLILFFGIALALVVMLLPGLVPAALLWLVLQRWLGYFVFVPAASVVTVIVFVEVLIATEALGPAFERLDLSAVERAE